LRALSDRLDRRRHVRRRHGWLEGIDRSSSAANASWSATICVTNVTRLADGIKRVAQFDPGQGQPDRHLTETLDAVEMAFKAGYTVVIAPFPARPRIPPSADLAVATNCGQIKTGSLARSDRTASTISCCGSSTNWALSEYAGRAALKRCGGGAPHIRLKNIKREVYDEHRHQDRASTTFSHQEERRTRNVAGKRPDPEPAADEVVVRVEAFADHP